MIDKDNSGEVDVDEMVRSPSNSFLPKFDFYEMHLQVAYFLQSAEVASDDKFEEKMKVFWFLNCHKLSKFSYQHAKNCWQDFRAFITDSLSENWFSHLCVTLFQE